MEQRQLDSDRKSAVVAFYTTHEDAEAAVRMLQQSGCDMKRLSIVGKDYQAEEQVVGYYLAAPATHSGRDVVLETRNLSRAIAGKVLVHEISVQVQQGELLAVVGPSGAGKSSFLRLLNRLDEPTGGTVLLDGEDYREIAPRELRRRIGMVMQMAYLFPERWPRTSPSAPGNTRRPSLLSRSMRCWTA